MNNLENLTFGNLTVVSRAENNKRGDALWLCKCSCGKESIVKGYNLKIGKTKSCGCTVTGPKRENIEGVKFGNLIALNFVSRNKHRGSLWRCMCDCGKETQVLISALSNGSIRSCGCSHSDKEIKYKGENNPNFNPQLTSEDRVRGRNFEEYRDWAKLVKQKDNHKCRICNSSPSGKLVSHHLDNYKDFPELRTNIDNGVCLCVEHHLEFHKTFGFTKNTKMQFLIFKEMKYERV